MLDLAQIILLPGCQRRLQRQVGHADDGIHRRPDFVAHIGQEIRFHPRRLFRHFFGAQQRFLRLFQRTDIDQHADQPPRTPISEPETTDRVHHLMAAAVAKTDFQLPHHRCRAPDQVHVFGVEGLTIRHRQIIKLQHCLAKQVVASRRKSLLVSLVAAKKPPCRIFEEEGIGQGIDQPGLKQQLIGQLLLGQLLLGHIQPVAVPALATIRRRGHFQARFHPAQVLPGKLDTLHETPPAPFLDGALQQYLAPLAIFRQYMVPAQLRLSQNFQVVVTVNLTDFAADEDKSFISIYRPFIAENRTR